MPSEQAAHQLNHFSSPCEKHPTLSGRTPSFRRQLNSGIPQHPAVLPTVATYEMSRRRTTSITSPPHARTPPYSLNLIPARNTLSPNPGQNTTNLVQPLLVPRHIETPSFVSV